MRVFNWFKRIFPKRQKRQEFRFPDLPSREAWVVKGYEPGSWTERDIELAKKTGWQNIRYHEVDEYPMLAGTWDGIAPDGFGRWYLPKLDSGYGSDEDVFMSSPCGLRLQ